MADHDARECRQLWCALLQQAIDDAFTGSGCRGTEHAMAIKFLFDEQRDRLVVSEVDEVRR